MRLAQNNLDGTIATIFLLAFLGLGCLSSAGSRVEPRARRLPLRWLRESLPAWLPWRLSPPLAAAFRSGGMSSAGFAAAVVFAFSCALAPLTGASLR